MLVSPGIDAERTLLLNVLEKLQSIALLLCPNARIVPAPPFEQCTNVPELVTLMAKQTSWSCADCLKLSC